MIKVTCACVTAEGLLVSGTHGALSGGDIRVMNLFSKKEPGEDSDLVRSHKNFMKLVVKCASKFVETAGDESPFREWSSFCY